MGLQDLYMHQSAGQSVQPIKQPVQQAAPHDEIQKRSAKSQTKNKQPTQESAMHNEIQKRSANLQIENRQPTQESAMHAEWLTLQQVGERSGYCVETLRRYIRKGLIPYQQAEKGCAIRIEWNAFQAALAKLREKTPY